MRFLILICLPFLGWAQVDTVQHPIKLKEWQAKEFEDIEKAKAQVIKDLDTRAERLFDFILKDNEINREAILANGVRLSGDSLILTMKVQIPKFNVPLKMTPDPKAVKPTKRE